MLAFIHIEKAAGQTLNWLMKRRYGLRHCYVEPWRPESRYFSADDFRTLSRCHPMGLHSIAGHVVNPWGDLHEAVPGIRYYTFLREPIARCASHYQYHVRKVGSRTPLREWLSNPTFHNFQVKRLAGVDSVDAAMAIIAERVEFTGIVERFDESLVLLHRLIGDPQLDIRYRRRNVAADSSIKDGLLDDPEEVEAIRRANELDIELYERVRESVFESYVSEYDGDLARDVATLRGSAPPRGPNLATVAYALQRWSIYKPAVYAHYPSSVSWALARVTSSVSRPKSD